MSLDPLVISFDVAAPCDHAFRAWTEHIDAWWPRSHSVSGGADLVVVLEPTLGGRIFERTSGGLEHDWGVITVWEPSRRLGYRWHLGQEAERATDVLLTFTALDDDSTRIEVRQSSWERLGSDAPSWRGRNEAGWSGVLTHYRHHLEGAS